MAKLGHTLHPATCRSDATELVVVVVLRVGVTGEEGVVGVFTVLLVCSLV